MVEKLKVLPISGGLRNDLLAFNIDDDTFPQLINAFQWRGRVKRKRGTILLNRLQRVFNSGATTITLDGSGIGNLISGFSLQANGSVSPGTVTITAPGPTVYTDPTMDGYFTPDGTGGSNTINYSTGEITIAAQAGQAVTAIFTYYPDLPVMGIEDLNLDTTDFSETIAFDTTYSYKVASAYPYNVTDVTFFKNPPVTTGYTNYVPKATPTAFTWNGANYQQFWSTNYSNAFWATNGIKIPFATDNIGMQFKTITTVTIVSASGPAVADLAIASHGLIVGDFVFINEVSTTIGINWQTGYVTDASNPNVIRVTFPNATLTNNGTGGIAQYLTNIADSTKDCIKWYDGTPSDTTGPGWVNFMPPLSQAIYSIADLPAAIYYLVGARLVVPFKDRLLFFGAVIQAPNSTVNTDPIYLRDTVIYSQNGTPYYTASYTNSPSSIIDTPTSATNTFFPMLVPENQTATSPSWFEDQTGFGGFLSAGVQQSIVSVASNEDALIVGFQNNLQTRFIFSGSDITPFNFFYINSELGTNSTFSTVNMDQGVISRGPRGIIMTSQTTCNRIDLPIPDQVFQVKNQENGSERFCAQRDFINEWVYFTYPSNKSNVVFPMETLLFNYRDNSWAIFRESYTTYGSFQKSTGNTWETLDPRLTWDTWNSSWESGIGTVEQPLVIAGNAQGFLMLRDGDTDEAPSLWIQSIASNIITSPDHCLNSGDFIQINDCLGPIGWQLNGRIFQVTVLSTDTLYLEPNVNDDTYLGNGTITRLYIPFIQSKQFPLAWEYARKTRIGAQRYLMTRTDHAQVTLNLYLSQNGSSPYTSDIINPDVNTPNNALIYSNVLYTCPESTNIGLTPANTNLNTPTASQQEQIWHRMNTSLIGDTIQFAITLSDEQMLSYTDEDTPSEITGATQASPCVLTCDGAYEINTLIRITGITEGMIELSDQIFIVLASDSTTVTIGIDSTAFEAYISGGTATPVTPENQTAEIEFHGCVLDVSPSSLLC